MNAKIYCVGGLTQHDNPIESCEVYDCIEDQWSSLPSLETARFSLSLVACPDRRFILGFGGCEQDIMSNNSLVEVILRLDTSDISKGWERLTINHVQRPMACQYGLTYLHTERGTHRYLIFGGITHHEELLTQVRTIDVNMLQLSKCAINPVTRDGVTEVQLPFEDRLYFN